MTPGRSRYLSTQAVAARLGLTSRTIRNWADIGYIPARRLGKQWRIAERDLEEWLRRSDDGVRFGGAASVTEMLSATEKDSKSAEDTETTEYESP